MRGVAFSASHIKNSCPHPKHVKNCLKRVYKPLLLAVFCLNHGQDLLTCTHANMHRKDLHPMRFYDMYAGRTEKRGEDTIGPMDLHR